MTIYSGPSVSVTLELGGCFLKAGHLSYCQHTDHSGSDEVCDVSVCFSVASLMLVLTRSVFLDIIKAFLWCRI